MLEISVTSKEKFISSNKITVESNKKYLISIKSTGIFGEQYCAYFGVVMFDEKDNEISRRIQWLNDFSGEEQIYKLVFTISKNVKYIKVIYRINEEVPIKSDCRYRLTPLEEIRFIETNEEEISYLPEDFILPKPRGPTPNDERELEKNIVWIFSSPRGGTSWLGTQLLEYKTLSINEPYIGFHLGINEPKIHDKIERNIDLFEKDPDYFFSSRYKKVWQYFLRKLILGRIYGQFQDTKIPIIIKEPNGGTGADIVLRCLPQSKMIFLIRDGRDVVDSWIDGLKKDSWFTKRYGFTAWNEKNKNDEIIRQSSYWVKTMEVVKSAYENHSKELRYAVKYENLRNNTFEELKNIYDFVGIKIPEKELEKIVEKYSFKNIPSEKKGSGKVTRSASPGKWKENFTQEEQNTMNEIMGEKLRELGY